MSVLAIWKERDKVVFEDDDFSLSRLKGSFVCSMCSWASLAVVSDYYYYYFFFFLLLES